MGRLLAAMETGSPTPNWQRSITRPSLAMAAALLGVAVLAGCGSSSKSSSNNQPAGGQTTAPASTRPASSSYNPKIDPAKFTNNITNPYFVAKPGTVRILKGTKDGVPQTHTTHITRKTRTIAGVKTLVIKDVVTNPDGVAEIAYDWYAQDQKGNVWYFGESTSDYAKGVVTTTKGSWETGVDGAKPGIVMPATPKPGPAFYQEFRPGVAEDKGKILGVNERVPTPSRTYQNAVRIRDTNPLDPTLVQNKWYVRGVGLVKSVRTGSSHTETSRLVSVRPER
jgi:hypothetical protein